MIRVMFVCTGNICRSPTAEGILRQKVAERGLADQIDSQSCGLIGYHTGEAPDPRAVRLATRRGYDLSRQRASRIRLDDFDEADYLLAMDQGHLASLNAMAPAGTHHKLSLLLAHLPDASEAEVPDPYYGDESDFIKAFDLIEAAVDAFLNKITQKPTSTEAARPT